MRNASGIRWRAAVIVLAGALVYANALDGPFLFDDENSIVNNPTISRLGTALSPPRDTPVAGRPVVNLTFALNYAADGLDVTGYHVVNVAIHVAVALLLFGVVSRTFRLKAEATYTNTATTSTAATSTAPRGARGFWLQPEDFGLACALIWLLHPLNSEAVNYLTERTESVMAFFYLLTLYCSIRGFRLQPEGKWTAAAIVACALGMLAKESMVTAPAAVVLYDRIFRFGSLREAFAARRGLYAGLAATWLVLAGVLLSEPRTSVGFDAGTTPWVYLLNQAEVITRYLWLTIWPRELVLDYGLPRALTLGGVLPQALLIVALLVATLAALWFKPAVGFLGAWFFLTLAPTSSFVPIATEVGAERRMYLPLMAVAVGVVLASRWALSRAPRDADKPRVPATFAVAIALICIALAAATLLRNQEYDSRLTMARTIVERRPHGRGHFLLGNELLMAGDRPGAMEQFRLSARDYPGARFALATELLASGDATAAEKELEAFLPAMPPTHQTIAPARDLLGRAYLSQRKFVEAAEQYRLLRELAPGYRGPANDVLFNYGYALAASGRLAESVPVLEQAVAANPSADAQTLLARVRAALASNALTNPGN
jgi:tetratricopeptide (TPR) repeat protein